MIITSFVKVGYPRTLIEVAIAYDILAMHV